MNNNGFSFINGLIGLLIAASAILVAGNVGMWIWQGQTKVAEELAAAETNESPPQTHQTQHAQSSVILAQLLESVIAEGKLRLEGSTMEVEHIRKKRSDLYKRYRPDNSRNIKTKREGSLHEHNL